MKRNALLTVTIVCLYAAFCAAVIGGCFNPDLSTATILCSAEKPDCPPEYTCQTPYCVPKATAMLADLSMSTADGSTASVRAKEGSPEEGSSEEGSPEEGDEVAKDGGESASGEESAEVEPQAQARSNGALVEPC